MDEDLYSIEEEFQLKDYDKDEHLKHLRQLEEQRNAEEQKEIELERIQRQIIDKLNIAEKSDNEIKPSDNAEMPSVDKTTGKQNGVHKSGKTDADKAFRTVQKSSEKRKVQSNRLISSFHSDAGSSNNHNSHYKGNAHQREGFHNMRQQRSRRGSRWRPSNYQRQQERYHIRLPNNSEQEFDHAGKQQIEHTKEQTKENFEFDLSTELFPINIEEEHEMLQEAIELSKQQMFIDKLERREVDKAIEETTRSQQEDRRKMQQQFNDSIMSEDGKDGLRTSLPNSDRSIASDGKHGANCNKHEKNNHSQTNITGNYKPVKPNKMQKPWSSDKQNGSGNRDSFQVRHAKSRNSYQTQKRSSDVCKPNRTNQIETMTPRTDSICGTLGQSNPNNVVEYDINSSKWKECARKDLKQLLRLDNSPDSSIRTDCIEIITEVVETSADQSNTIGAEASNRHDMSINEVSYKENYYTEEFNGRPPAKSSYIGNRNNYIAPVSFGPQNYSSSHKTGARSRISERRTTRVLHKGKSNSNGTNDNESVCTTWVPYRKLMEEGRTDSIPPRFRKQCQQITY